ncbi:MAG: YfhO family protein, partial [Lachnospiraceae bacterium]|nr:YfhO family protein [Lachnospiraceae bacterium]
LLKDILKGNPLDLIRNYYIGSGKGGGVGMVNTFFCGTIVLIGVLGLFSVSKDVMQKKHRLVYAGLLVFTVPMFYFGPLYMLFSLLKQSAGHDGRYLYLGTFIFVYLAGRFFCHIDKVNKKPFIITAVVYLLVFAACQVRYPVKNKALIIYTVAEFAALFILLFIYSRDLSKRKVLLIPVTLLVFAELAFNAYRVLDIYDNYREYTAADFAAYERSEQEFIDRIAAYDNDFYRINQLQNRDMSINETTANYNEAMAFSYASAEGYTSTPHGSQLDFLARGGYRNEGETPSVVSETSIIPFDSLLGVKYILSPFAVRGYEKVADLPGENGKDVYLNPNVIPVVCKVSSAPGVVYATDPFEYHQGLVSSLTGTEASFYEPVSFDIKDEDELRTYELTLSDGNYAFYGYIPWKWKEMGGTHIDINGKIKKKYSAWNSEDLFYVPVDDGADKAYVTLDGRIPDVIDFEKFYALDLDAFEKAIAPLKGADPDELEIKNGRVYAKLSAAAGEYLFTTIPFDRGWKVKLNGRVIKPETYEYCFMLIPLEEGENVITMDYHIPFLPAGIFLTVLGIVLVFVNSYKERRHEEGTKKETP